MTSQNTKLPKIILGCRIGKLEVIAPTDVRKSNYIVFDYTFYGVIQFETK